MQEGGIIQSSVAKWDWTENSFLPKQDTASAASEVLVFT